MAPSNRNGPSLFNIFFVFVVLSLLLIANCDVDNGEKYKGLKIREQTKEILNGVEMMKFGRKLAKPTCVERACGFVNPNVNCYCCNPYSCYDTKQECDKVCH
ncbi:uncharacterized protein [Spinacia oleracea]|uniref:Embryo surrounding factor 1 brassicaceae domain-containing protein n=1 Tax=Spinacia oleracea TaxID=3562 RepID=A0ABM3RGE0_SPIOL|nr:uncharacterized protein LOC130469408 [Spinacia oleracea]